MCQDHVAVTCACMTQNLWEKEVGCLADGASWCSGQGLLADVLYVCVLQPNNG